MATYTQVRTASELFPVHVVDQDGFPHVELTAYACRSPSHHAPRTARAYTSDVLAFASRALSDPVVLRQGWRLLGPPDEARRLVSHVLTTSMHCVLVIGRDRLGFETCSVSEMHNVLLGLNVFDRDVTRAGDLLGFGSDRAAALRNLRPGEFFAFGPALCRLPTLVRIAPTVTRHIGATPDLVASADVTPDEARGLLDLDALRDAGRAAPALPVRGGLRALDCFLMEPHAADAVRVVAALRTISPNATTAADLSRHLGAEMNAVHGALDLLGSAGAVDTMPRGEARIARLSARLRLRGSDTNVVGLA